jgi:hypothetical protein
MRIFDKMIFMETKICTKCGVEKPITEFYNDKQKPDRHRPDCKKCNIVQCSAWAKRNPSRRKSIMTKYNTGLTPVQYDNVHTYQNGQCAICGKTASENGKKLAVDHCHDTMLVRGLLCTTCNFALGYFQDNELLLLKAITYLKENYSSNNIKYNGKAKNSRDK